MHKHLGLIAMNVKAKVLNSLIRLRTVFRCHDIH